MSRVSNIADWVGFYKECGHTVEEISTYLNLDKKHVKRLIKKYNEL